MCSYQLGAKKRDLYVVKPKKAILQDRFSVKQCEAPKKPFLNEAEILKQRPKKNN